MSDRGFTYQAPLDGLRAIAVAAVIAYHLGLGATQGGFLGVDAFFVLSGYLITSLLLVEWSSTGRIDLGAFWVRRARRLLPALLLVLAAVAVYAAVAVSPEELGKLRADGLATLFYGANWRLVFSGESYFDLFSNPSPFRHAWSLAIEEQFYIVWPLVTFACLRLARGRRWLLAGVCVGGAAASMATMAALYEPGGDPSRAYYGTDARAHALLLGVALAIVLSRWTPRAEPARASVRFAGIAGALYMAFAFTRVHDTDPWMYRGGYALFAVAVTAVIASVVQPGAFPLRRLLSLPPVVWVGKISYGLYLWHWPVIVVLTPVRTGLDGAMLDVARVAVTVALSTVSFYLVEQPIRRGALSRLPRRLVFAVTPSAFALAGLAVVLATAGAKPLPDYVSVKAGSIVVESATPPDADPSRANLSGDAPASPSAGAPRVLVVGDSVAHSLYPSLERSAYVNQVALSRVTAAGCGIAGGLVTDDSGTPYAWSHTCADGIPGAQERAVAFVQPEVVVWLSVWETSNRIIDGRVLEFGTKASDQALRDEIDIAARRLTAGGARLVLVTLPLPAHDAEVPPAADYDEKISHLNRLLRDYAAAHPDTVQLLDLGAIVCPTGPPCPADVGGMRPRPRDGIHYEGPGADYVAEQLMGQLLGLSPSSAAAKPTVSVRG
jgi:peptidoglycan/LPS O-acetylase OafA/YrhL